MSWRICRIVAAMTFVSAAELALPGGAFAQQNKSEGAVEEMLKAIGLRKPAISRAPDFNLRDANGGMSSLSGYRGSLVLLNFWATWCGPCREEMPSMEALSRNFGGQGLVVVAVNQRENAALVNRFMKTQGLNFATPLDIDGRVAQSYRVYGIPATYLIDRTGQPIGLKSGPKDWAAPDVVGVFRKLVVAAGSGAVAGSMDLEAAIPLPRGLRAKATGTLVRSQQDPDSDIVAKLERGEEMALLAEVSGSGESWYMVRTKSGAVGWVRGTEVEGVRIGK